MAYLALAAGCLWLAAVLRHLVPAALGRRGGRWTAERLDELLFIAPVHGLLWGGRMERLAVIRALLTGVHSDRQRLVGMSQTVADTRTYLSRVVGLGFAACGSLALLSSVIAEPALLAMGAFTGMLVPAARIRSLRIEVEERRRAILTELPELLTRLMLLVGAGESLQGALQRCAAGGAEGHPLYRELAGAMYAVRNGESFHQAMDGFARRTGVQEAAVLSAALLLQYRKGGMEFVLSLRELSFTLWEKRKAIARTRGEEAASKLSLPLVVIFFVLMVLVGSPAVLSM